MKKVILCASILAFAGLAQAKSSLPPDTDQIAANVTVKDVKDAYESMTESAPLDGMNVARQDLKGEALAAYNENMKTWGDDYPPMVVWIEVKGVPFIAMDEETDGGMFLDIFTKDGKAVAGGSCGESESFSWSN